MNDSITPQHEIQLADYHRRLLENEKSINTDIVDARGYRTISDAEELSTLGFSPNSCPRPGLLIPLHSTDEINENYIYRPDDPKRKKAPKHGHKNSDQEYVVKYLSQKGKGVQLDCPPICQDFLKDLNSKLYITDDPIKADFLASSGYCAIAVVGLWSFMGKANPEQIIQLPDWDYINFNKRHVIWFNDSDTKSDQQIRKLIIRLTIHFKRKTANVEIANIPLDFDYQNSKLSMDSVTDQGQDSFEGIVEISKSFPSPKPPTYTIVTDEEMEMSRPLCLLGGKAYAATWKKVKETITEEVDSDGNIITLDPPRETIQSRLIIMRDNGTVYGGEQPIESSGIEIHLREMISPENNWGPKGVNSFLRGVRPEPVIIFQHLVDVINQFIDFHKSLAEQRTMCEFVACFILSTWFLDAFDVIGYLWINGERGSGKTNLLFLISQLSYLGLFISQTGSFASLRDMADYGATLACDDAENITDPKKTDPDKRALLLSGNRKGLTVPIKEKGTDKNWHVRHVKAYCARAFSAIGLPDSTMSSRTIILPLLRTPNKSKGNIDPNDLEIWAHNRKSLVDDLWSLALTNLSKLPEWSKWVGKNAQLVGRNLQPWRAILAVAKWLEINGVSGLYEKIELLSLTYQNERPELETADETRVVIQALCECAISAISANKNVRVVKVSVSDVTDTAINIIEDQEIDLNPDWISTGKVGRILAKLRFPEVPRPGGKGSRIREINLQDLVDLAESFNIEIKGKLCKLGVLPLASLSGNGTNGTNGSDGSIETQKYIPETNPEYIEPIKKQCWSCDGLDFWERDDGQMICNRCHPNYQR